MEPLSKKIGVWDNAQKNSEIQQRENTIGEMKRCINKNTYLQSLRNKNELEFKIRGSISKGNDVTENSDLDLHIIVSKRHNLMQMKNTVYNQLKTCFGKKNVIRNDVTFSIMANINRIKTDVLVAIRHDEKMIYGLHDSNGKKVEFYPDVDEKNINTLNSQYNHNYSKMVRTYKGLKHEMSKQGYAKSSNRVTSFMIECLLYNCKHTLFDINKYSDCENNEQKYRKMFLDLKSAIFSSQLASYEASKKHSEINGEKKLFTKKKYWETTRRFFEDLNKHLKSNYDVNS